MQLCFFIPGLRVGGCTEVLANTLLGVFHSLVLSEVGVSPTLIQGPWSARCWVKRRTRAGRLWPILIFPSSPMLSWAPCVWSERVSVMYSRAPHVFRKKWYCTSVCLISGNFNFCLSFWQMFYGKLAFPPKKSNSQQTEPGRRDILLFSFFSPLYFSTWDMNFGAASVSGVNSIWTLWPSLLPLFTSLLRQNSALVFMGILPGMLLVHSFAVFALSPFFFFFFKWII